MLDNQILLTTPSYPYPTLPANDSLTDATGQRFTKGDDAFTIISHTHCYANHILAQNIEVPLKEHTKIPHELRRELADLKISMVGLPPDAADKFPAELSGGMRKRAGLARALALDPEILFLDEPTAGLDPIGAAAFDTLIGDLKRALGLTVVMVTHDLDSLHAICDRIAVLIDKRVKLGTIAGLLDEPDPWIQEYFRGPRGRAAQATAQVPAGGPGAPGTENEATA